MLVSVDDDATTRSLESIATYVISPTRTSTRRLKQPVMHAQIFTKRSSPPVTNLRPLLLSTAQYAASLCARSVRKQSWRLRHRLASATAPPVSGRLPPSLAAAHPRDSSSRAYDASILIIAAFPESNLRALANAFDSARPTHLRATGEPPLAKSSNVASCVPPKTSTRDGNDPSSLASRSNPSRVHRTPPRRRRYRATTKFS